MAIDEALRRGKYPSVEKLCEMFEVQPRTIYQDLKDLKEKAGMAIKFDRDKKGYYNAEPERRLPTFMLTEHELFLLSLAAEFFIAHTGPSFEAALHNALKKVWETAVASDGIDLTNIRSCVTITPPDQKISSSVFCNILEDIANGKPREVGFIDDAGKERVLSILPRRILFEGFDWSVVADCDGDGDGAFEGEKDGLMTIPMSKISRWGSRQD